MSKQLTPEQLERKRINSKIYYEKNKDKIKNYQKEYNKLNTNKVKTAKKIYDENYSKINRERINKVKNEYRTKRKKEDHLYRLSCNVRSGVNSALKRNAQTKKSKTINILGCSVKFLKEHLEKQFELWMNWNNYGMFNNSKNYGWDIDHIIPLSSAKNEEELIKLLHYSNLQPLCSYINRIIKKDN